MAEEKMENYEEQEDGPSKKGLIFSIIAFILIIILLITGIVLFFIIRDRREGEINIEGTNVNIEANSRIEGMSNPPLLAPIFINTEDDDDEVPVSSSWENVNLVFEDKEQIISVYITIINNNDANGLEVIYFNNTTQTNLIIEDYYYLNNQSSFLTPVENQDSIPLDAGSSITFVATFEIKDYNSSVNDILNITIQCNNIEV